MPSLVDFHCHLDLYPDYPGIASECDRDGIRVLTVTTTPRAWPRNREVASRTAHVHAALGLHPQLVAERADELTLWEQFLPEARFVGEVGLDAGPRFHSSIQKQKEVFARILRACAAAGDKILTVHSLRSAKTVLDMIEANLPPERGRVVLHWFTGTAAEARRAIDMGSYFSVNAEMMRSERHFDLIAQIPLERILTETDGPFTKAGASPARPADVAAVLKMLEAARRLPAGSAGSTVEANLDRLLS